jgi:predicted MFS family arabinose efflux permease
MEKENVLSNIAIVLLGVVMAFVISISLGFIVGSLINFF